MQRRILDSILGISFASVLAILPTIGLANVRSQMPDPYAEPGLNPFRDQVSANASEFIDPFSGVLHLRHVDLFIPGHGGLDIKIQRTYNSNAVYLSRKTPTNIAPNLTQHPARTPYGLGWTLHFGRVLKTGTGVAPNICDTNSSNPNDDTLDNAILELPDGSQQILFVNATSFGQPSTIFITKEQWVASCISGGLLVISPEGTKYTMDYVRSGGLTYTADTVDYAWYTTRIEDRNGNWMTISYDTGAASTGKEPVFSQITTSDGRTVAFSYLNRTVSTQIRLNTISANGQTWAYLYDPVTDYAGGYYQLMRVSGPSGFTWQYSYYARSAAETGTPGNRVLSIVTYPYGGTVVYSYGYECFNAPASVNYQCNSATEVFYSLVVLSKTNGGRDAPAGGVNGNRWGYSYNPGTIEDVTTVTFPGGRHVYRHFGSREMLGLSTTSPKNLWRIGLLKRKETWNGGTRINDETFTWQPLYRISNEKYVRPPYDPDVYFDNDVFAPVLTSKQIVRDGTTYTTTYGNFDASFNPRTITETGPATNRTTTLTYFPRTTGQNIVRLVEDETVTMGGVSKTIDRTFSAANVNLLSISRYGVLEIYTYDAFGNLASKRNARNNTWTYSNHHRGIPRNESHPEGVSISRTVNNTGTIASETNGREFTTSYLYDGMNRLTRITRPSGLPITVNWNTSGTTTTGRTVTRGVYTQTIDFDGFGRPSFVNTAGVTKNINYNALGHTSFESYLSVSTGDSYGTDVLGRVTSITHPDGTSRSFSYLSGNQVRITNERGIPTTYTYRSFGDPDNANDRVLTAIGAPEGVTTTIGRNVLGQITSVAQGGLTRTYGYNPANNFLTSTTNPETGTTVFGRDAVGNMTSRSVNGSPTTVFTYDGLNRLASIDHPGTTPDVAFSYDGNNNVRTALNGVSSRSYDYDNNDNLISESLTVNGRTYNASYGYNSLDYLQSITYPSTQVIFLAPDALGRPTTVTPYITTAIAYHPTGMPADFLYANGRRTDTSINNRQWVSRIRSFNAVGYVSLLDYAYDGVGNVRSITDSVESSFNRNLSYDGLDRLIIANGSWGSGTIGYDTRGNITNQSLGSFGLTYSYNTTNNRLTGVSGSRQYTFGYDVYGNVTSNGNHTFVYDDASNLRTVSGPTSVSYTYDANNMRVRVQEGAKDTYVFYAKNGDLLGEYEADGRFKEYFYLGGKLIAMRAVSPSNQAPTANAGSDQDVGEGTPVVLTGSGSDANGDPLTYSWQQLSGPSVTLSNPTSATTGFTAPRVTVDVTFAFAFRVDDGDYGGRSSDTVSVIVRNTNPDDDNDGLADTWEMQHFGTLAFGPNDDPDNDGLANQQEFNEGTNPNSADPAPSQVTVVTAQGGLSSNSVSWQTVTRAASYNLYWSTSPGVTKATGNKIAGVSTPHAHPNLTNGTTYYYVVTAQNNSGESPESPEVSATPTIAPLIPILDLLLGE